MSNESVVCLSRMLLFISAGVLWSIFADILSVMQYKCKNACIKMLTDFIWMSSAGLIIFLLTVSIMQDNLRGYMVVSFVSASAVWHVTAGRLLRRIIILIYSLAVKLFRTVLKCAKCVFTALLYPFSKTKRKNNEKNITKD